MQDPKKEIRKIVHTLCTTRNADELERTVNQYFVSDAKFSHPLCRANSRNEILGLFQWYRLASPEVNLKIPSVMYDPELNVLVLEVVEKINVWFLPFPSKEGRLVIRLQLSKANGAHHIVSEEDLAHPVDQLGLLGSPFVPLGSIYVKLGCIISNLGACAFRVVGLNWGLDGGNINYAGLMESIGIARKSRAAVNGSAKEQN